jgi:hypothetical protein
MQNKFYFLQANPNGGLMSIVLLVFAVGLTILIFRMTKRKSSIEVESHINSCEEDKTVSNADIQIAGFELIEAGKSLITAFVILLCAIPANILLTYFITLYNTSYVNPYTTTPQIPLLVVLYVFYFIIGIVAVVKFINGYIHIKKAGERLFNI